MIAILIPCKRFSLGKQRLAPVLSPAERSALCRDMLARTVALAREVSPDVHVVTDDIEAGAVAAEHGASVIRSTGEGLNRDLEDARRRLSLTMSRLVVLPTDLVFATAQAIAEVCESDADVVIVPDREREGTNVLVLSNAAAARLPFRFGGGSFHLHRGEALAEGYRVTIVESQVLSFDLDEPDDWLCWHAGASSLRAAAG